MTNWKAGAAVREIQIPAGYPAYEHFSVQSGPIHVRALAVTAGEPFLLVSLELTSLMGDVVGPMREAAARATGIPVKHVWICTTHSFSSPHLLPDEMLGSAEAAALKEKYRENLFAAVTGAAAEAAAAQKEAVLSFGEAECGIVANRDVLTEDGWWVGTGGDGPTDRTAHVAKLTGTDGTPIAMLLHYGMQSSVMDQSESRDGGKIITGDVAGMACAAVEAALPGAVCLFLIGAAGDQAPVEKSVTEWFEKGAKKRKDLHEDGLVLCETLAKKLADAALAAARDAKPTDGPGLQLAAASFEAPAKKMNGTAQSLTPTKEAIYTADGSRQMTIDGLRLGNIALVGVKPELNCITGQCIAQGSPFAHTLVCTMVNGAAKYMADAASYDTFRYEALNSPWGRGAAEALAQKAADLLQELKKK